MVKIFIGNLSQHAAKDEVEALFAQYGTVSECAKYKNYAFVHMEDRKAATKAIRELNLHELNGRPINVELSRARSQGPLKLHVANVERGFNDELRALFEEYGPVTECAIIKDFAFVHMSNADEAMDAIKGLDNAEFQGKRIHVKISNSRPRGPPEDDAYPQPPNRGGYYPPRYPGVEPGHEPYSHHMSPYPPPPPPPPRRGPYPDYGYGEPNDYGMMDYYQKYRAYPSSGVSYDAIPPPPPPPSGLAREHYGMGSLDPYERPQPHQVPPSHAVRDRSPIRRAPVAPATAAGNGVPYDHSQMPAAPMYAAPHPSVPYLEGAQLPPPPPPQHYAGY